MERRTNKRKQNMGCMGRQRRMASQSGLGLVRGPRNYCSNRSECEDAYDVWIVWLVGQQWIWAQDVKPREGQRFSLNFISFFIQITYASPPETRTSPHRKSPSAAEDVQTPSLMPHSTHLDSLFHNLCLSFLNS